LLTAFLAAWVIGRFEAAIQQLVAPTILMPIIAGMGGVADCQTLTLSIRGLALGQISRQNSRPLMLRELMVGLFNGVIWALVIAVATMLWFGDQRPGADPAIAGGVILTTVTDVVGFMAFLGLATVFLLP